MSEPPVAPTLEEKINEGALYTSAKLHEQANVLITEFYDSPSRYCNLNLTDFISCLDPYLLNFLALYPGPIFQWRSLGMRLEFPSEPRPVSTSLKKKKSLTHIQPPCLPHKFARCMLSRSRAPVLYQQFVQYATTCMFCIQSLYCAMEALLSWSKFLTGLEL